MISSLSKTAVIIICNYKSRRQIIAVSLQLTISTIAEIAIWSLTNGEATAGN